MATVKPFIVGRKTDAQLKQMWRRWTGVIQRVVMPRRRTFAVTSRDYRQLHQELIRVLDLAGNSNEAKDCVYRRLRKLCKPWVTLESVQQAEKPVLRNLLVRCHQEEVHWCGHALGGGRAISVKAVAIAGLAAMMTFAYLSLDKSFTGSDGLILRAQETFSALRHRVAHATFFQKYVVIAGFMVLACIRILIFRGR